MEEELIEEGKGESSSSPRGFAVFDIKKDLLNKLAETRNEEAISNPDFKDQFDAHFNRLPTSHLVDVTVDRAEDVLLHQKILAEAKDTAKRPVLHVRFTKLEEASLESDIRTNTNATEEGRSIDETLSPRHDVTYFQNIFSTIDKPKLVSQGLCGWSPDRAGGGEGTGRCRDVEDSEFMQAFLIHPMEAENFEDVPLEGEDGDGAEGDGVEGYGAEGDEEQWESGEDEANADGDGGGDDDDDDDDDDDHYLHEDTDEDEDEEETDEDDDEEEEEEDEEEAQGKGNEAKRKRQELLEKEFWRRNAELEQEIDRRSSWILGEEGAENIHEKMHFPLSKKWKRAQKIEMGGIVAEEAEGEIQIGGIVAEEAGGEIQMGGIVAEEAEGQIQMGGLVAEEAEGQIQMGGLVAEEAEGQIQIGGFVTEEVEEEIRAEEVDEEITPIMMVASRVLANELLDQMLLAVGEVNNLGRLQYQNSSFTVSQTDGGISPKEGFTARFILQCFRYPSIPSFEAASDEVARIQDKNKGIPLCHYMVFLRPEESGGMPFMDGRLKVLCNRLQQWWTALLVGQTDIPKVKYVWVDRDNAGELIWHMVHSDLTLGV